MKTAEQLSPPVSQWMVQALTRLIATFAILQGASIVIGGSSRWGSPGLRIAMLVPYAPSSWGVALGALGLIALVGTFVARHRLTALAMWGIGAWCLFFAVSLGAATMRDPSVSTLGFFTYFMLAIIACCLSIAYIQSMHWQNRLRSI